MLSNCANIQQSTFPHQPKAGGPPFLSRTGNALCSFHLDANAFLRSVTLISSTILPYTPTLWNQLSTRQTAGAVGRQLFYAIPYRIVNRQKLYRRKASKIFPSLEDHILIKFSHSIVHNVQSPALKQTRLPYIKISRICRHSRQSVVSNPSACQMVESRILHVWMRE